ncbi:MAG: hypothetical protein AAFX53_14890 [Bacteroidota bacterium]
MKKVVSTLIVLGMFQVVFSQGDFDKSLEFGFPVVSNLTYLSEVSLAETPNVVRKLQLKAATFPIRNVDGYERDESDSFVVVHKASNGGIIVNYDTHGEILRTWERFQNVSLPKPIRELLAKKYKGWKIRENRYRGSFAHGKAAKALYRIKLVKGKKTKKIELNALEI